MNHPTTYQSVSKSIKQSTSEWIRQSANLSINQSSSQSTNQSVNQPINKSTNRPISHPNSKSINQPSINSTIPSIHQLINHSLSSIYNILSQFHKEYKYWISYFMPLMADIPEINLFTSLFSDVLNYIICYHANHIPFHFVSIDILACSIVQWN